MKVELINYMGDDLSVVNAARVSFNKLSDWAVSDDYMYSELHKKDEKLIQYLAKHNHWTPFAHTAITLHIKVPLFVARQIHKHQAGFVVNEVSRRYVKDEVELYAPIKWRKSADNVKQGSSEESVVLEEGLYGFDIVDDHNIQSLRLYHRLIEEGVCPEQARMVLPQSMYTEFWMTGNLYGWFNLYKKRIDPHTQKETQEVARQVGNLIETLFPVSWKALRDSQC